MLFNNVTGTVEEGQNGYWRVGVTTEEGSHHLRLTGDEIQQLPPSVVDSRKAPVIQLTNVKQEQFTPEAQPAPHFGQHTSPEEQANGDPGLMEPDVGAGGSGSENTRNRPRWRKIKHHTSARAAARAMIESSSQVAAGGVGSPSFFQPLISDDDAMDVDPPGCAPEHDGSTEGTATPIASGGEPAEGQVVQGALPNADGAPEHGATAHAAHTSTPNPIVDMDGPQPEAYMTDEEVD